MSRFEMKLSGEVLRIVEKHEVEFAGRTDFVRQAIIQYDLTDCLRKIVREEITSALNRERRIDNQTREDETANIEYEALSFEELDNV